jgi:hypothetical protein
MKRIDIELVERLRQAYFTLTEPYCIEILSPREIQLRHQSRQSPSDSTKVSSQPMVFRHKKDKKPYADPKQLLFKTG